MTTTTPPTYEVSYVHDGRRVSYEADAVTPAEIHADAMDYCNVRADGYGTFDAYREAYDRAASFAIWCVAELLDDTGDWCDPTRSFRDLWERYLSDHNNA